MKIIVADDEPIILEEVVEILQELEPEAEIYDFLVPEDLLEFAEDNQCDVAFLDIEMGTISGVQVAKKLKQIYPKINIIFVTGYSEYAQVAFKIRASGYVLKPPTKKNIKEELENLRNPVSFNTCDKLVVQCFGNFDVFMNGVPIKFQRNKSKELLAFLIDRRGSAVTAKEICSILWENSEHDIKNIQYLQKLKSDLIKALKEVGAEKVFLYSRNNYSINVDEVSCDYYDYINDKPEGVRAYNGEYMKQYSWAEVTNANIVKEK